MSETDTRTEERIRRDVTEFNRCRKLHDRMRGVSTGNYGRMLARKEQMNFCSRKMRLIRERFDAAGYDVTYSASGLITRVEY